MSQDGRRRADEIESEIHQARARLDETLHQLEARLSPEQLMNMTYDYLRRGGAERIITSLVHRLKETPLPVMVTGIGLGWLVLAQRKAHAHHHEALPRQGGYPGATLPSASMPGTSMASYDGRETVSGAGTTTLGHDPAALGATPQHGTEAHDNGSGMTRKAQHMAESMRERAEHAGGRVKERMHHMNDQMRERAAHLDEQRHAAMDAASYRAREAGSQTIHFVQEHPLVAGALGVAVGAVLGSLFAPTRVENRHLGELRDRAVQRAEEAGHEQAERAQEKLHEGVDRVKEEIRERAQDASQSQASHSSNAASYSSNAASYVENPSSEERFSKAGSSAKGGTDTQQGEATKKGGNTPPAKGS
ncbi:DUF3618 domain-containing protein [Billgrantia aerodenitrificans]|uniref:DUF3618 domain-containing protein n=1 Tax=Billgrantia aerodenitrificans TaxID=2733483 RepID=A0ABS9AM56_9GAMM|nr:DUF3618 domain-containing protein [Halomonas aerodenitrificans]MCE8022814.1 DUF3618 domain-containing protein [Halomonas aerodenitrificans]